MPGDPADVVFRCAPPIPEAVEQARAELRVAAQQACRVLEERAAELSRRAHPRAALHVFDASRAHPMNDSVGAWRAAYALASSASGQDDTLEVWQDYLDTTAAWFACIAELTAVTDAVQIDERIHTAETLARIAGNNETQTLAFSLWLIDGMVRWPQLRDFPEVAAWLNAPTIRAFLEWVLDPGTGRDGHSVAAYPPPARPLVDVLTVDAGSRAGESLMALHTQHHFTRYPFLRIDGRACFLGVGIVTSLEQTLLRATHGVQGFNGKVFEHAVQHALAIALRGRAHVTSGDIRRPGEAGLESDLIMVTGSAVLVAELKSYLPPRYEQGVVAAFDEDLTKALAQVDRRLQAVRSGDAVLRTPAGDRPVPREAVGAVVTAHSYGATVWDSPALHDVHPQRSTPIMPVQSLLLAASAMRDGDELVRYLRWRERQWGQSVWSPDELEPLVSYLVSGGGYEYDHGGMQFMVPRSLPAEVVFKPSLGDPEQWRAYLTNLPRRDETPW